MTTGRINQVATLQLGAGARSLPPLARGAAQVCIEIGAAQAVFSKDSPRQRVKFLPQKPAPLLPTCREAWPRAADRAA